MTDNSATISLDYYTKPLLVKLILTNTQDNTEMPHIFESYESNPYLLTNLKPNSNYSVVVSVIFHSGNQYNSTFLNAIQT